MRGRRVVALLALALLMGCDEAADAEPAARKLPAAVAGIACQLIEYEPVFVGLGVRFDTAGGGRSGDTVTCALMQAASPYPYLTLAVTPSAASEVIFRATIVPTGSTPVPDLGRVSYQLGLVAADGSGPGVELCWLSATRRLLVLRYVFPATATPEEITAMTAKLVALAQKVDKSLPA